MESIGAKKIKLDRVITALDSFVIGAIRIISKHTSYVIVSGYVAILFGRTRTTEDIDVVIPGLSAAKFSVLFKELESKGYWSINAASEKTNYELLKTRHSMRIARKGELVPNVELKFAKDDLDGASLRDAVTVILSEGTLQVSPLELQIAYKEKILGSEKDLEDAKHLFEVFKGSLNIALLEKYRKELGK